MILQPTSEINYQHHDVINITVTDSTLKINPSELWNTFWKCFSNCAWIICLSLKSFSRYRPSRILIASDASLNSRADWMNSLDWARFSDSEEISETL